jgi:hypothetical protein
MKIIDEPSIDPLMKECDELIAIIVASIKTVKNKR